MTAPKSFGGFSQDDARKYLEEQKNNPGNSKPEAKPAKKSRKKSSNLPLPAAVLPAMLPPVFINPPKPVQRDPSIFGIEKIANSEYRMHGLKYRDNCLRVRFTTYCLENNASHSLDYWDKYSHPAALEKKYVVPSLPLEYAIWKEMFKYQATTTDGKTPLFRDIWFARQELQKTLGEHAVMMISNVNYNSKNGDDEICHKDTNLHQSSTFTKFQGPNDAINGALVSEDVCDALFLTKRKDEVSDVISWITGSSPQLLRFSDFQIRASLPLIVDASKVRTYLSAINAGDQCALGVFVENYTPIGGSQ